MGDARYPFSRLPPEVRCMEEAVLAWTAIGSLVSGVSPRESLSAPLEGSGTSLRCSGFFVGRRLFVSSFHCAGGLYAGGAETWVLAGAQKKPFLPSRVVAVSVERDLVIVETKEAYTDRVVSLEASSPRIWGSEESVYVMGYRGGELKTLSGRRNFFLPRWVLEPVPKMEDMGGLSGSPVFNAEGNVIGIVQGQSRDSLAFVPVRELIDLAAVERIALNIVGTASAKPLFRRLF